MKQIVYMHNDKGCYLSPNVIYKQIIFTSGSSITIADLCSTTPFMSFLATECNDEECDSSALDIQVVDDRCTDTTGCPQYLVLALLE